MLTNKIFNASALPSATQLITGVWGSFMTFRKLQILLFFSNSSRRSSSTY